MTKQQMAKKFGIVVRRLRKLQGLSQEEFAVYCGLHRTYIGSIERGEKNVTLVTTYKIAEALEITMSELIDELQKELDKPS